MAEVTRVTTDDGSFVGRCLVGSAHLPQSCCLLSMLHRYASLTLGYGRTALLKGSLHRYHLCLLINSSQSTYAFIKGSSVREARVESLRRIEITRLLYRI